MRGAASGKVRGSDLSLPPLPLLLPPVACRQTRGGAGRKGVRAQFTQALSSFGCAPPFWQTICYTGAAMRDTRGEKNVRIVHYRQGESNISDVLTVWPSLPPTQPHKPTCPSPPHFPNLGYQFIPPIFVLRPEPSELWESRSPVDQRSRPPPISLGRLCPPSKA